MVADASDFPEPGKHFIAAAANFTDIGSVLDTVLAADDCLSDNGGVGSSCPTSESEEFEFGWEDEVLGDEDREWEPIPPIADGENPDEFERMDLEELGFGDSPLLNQAQQAEVERSQEPHLQPEVKRFGGRA